MIEHSPRRSAGYANKKSASRNRGLADAAPFFRGGRCLKQHGPPGAASSRRMISAFNIGDIKYALFCPVAAVNEVPSAPVIGAVRDLFATHTQDA